MYRLLLSSRTDQVLNLPSTSQTSDPSPLPHPLCPILSLNHNWLNSTTLLRTYHTLLADIDACSTAIADIHHLLSTRAEPGWEQAWFDEVQELVRRDSGWGWDEFWGCVRWGCEVRLPSARCYVLMGCTRLTLPRHRRRRMPCVTSRRYGTCSLRCSTLLDKSDSSWTTLRRRASTRRSASSRSRPGRISSR